MPGSARPPSSLADVSLERERRGRGPTRGGGGWRRKGGRNSERGRDGTGPGGTRREVLAVAKAVMQDRRVDAGGGKDGGVLTGEAVEAVEGAEGTLLHPAGRGSGGMKPAARATGETAAGPCGARAAIRGPGAGWRLRKIHGEYRRAGRVGRRRQRWGRRDWQGRPCRVAAYWRARRR
jgi:hypothetical protein